MSGEKRKAIRRLKSEMVPEDRDVTGATRPWRFLSVTLAALVAVAVLPVAGLEAAQLSGDRGSSRLRKAVRLSDSGPAIVESFDGTELDGWLYLPERASETRVPVVLWSSPYFGQMIPAPGDTEVRSGFGVPVNYLLSEGFAVALFNVRGTGNSGGCFEFLGKREQRDQKFLVEWLASRDWSNGRVGMMGLSYDAGTTMAAAVQRPTALKAIVVSGMITDLYTLSATPQGAYRPLSATTTAFLVGDASFKPPTVSTAEHATIAHLSSVTERPCPEVARMVASSHTDVLTDSRMRDFYSERRFIDRMPRVRAATFMTHGFRDVAHGFQEDLAWQALRGAPKYQYEGQWGHQFPEAFEVRLVEWFDHWLRPDSRDGAGPPLGLVDFEDSAGTWHRTTSWPPQQAHNEVLYMGAAELSPTPGEGPAVFRAAPEDIGHLPGEDESPPPLCPPPADALARSAMYVSRASSTDVLIAGNPFAALRIQSDLPAGHVAVTLVDLYPDFACSNGQPENFRVFAEGAADLRFHRGSFQGSDFPVNTPVTVRVDLPSVAHRLLAEHRLAVVISHGRYVEYASTPVYPEVTLETGPGFRGSQIVLPVMSGSSLGLRPEVTYPPRPFWSANGQGN